jgi:hypothetical protein
MKHHSECNDRCDGDTHWLKGGENIWAPDRSATERAERLRRERAERCERGYHEDPDHSGACILCGFVWAE